MILKKALLMLAVFALLMNINYVKAQTAEEWVEQGAKFFEKEQDEEALECFNRALEIDPENGDAWCFKGMTLYFLEKDSQAITCLEKAIKINPENGNAWYYKGWCLYMLEQDEEAIECFNKAISINSNDYAAWFGKGKCFYMMGDYETALECFDKSLNIKPGYENALKAKKELQAALNGGGGDGSVSSDYINWAYNLDDAKEKSEAGGKYIFAVFAADW